MKRLPLVGREREVALDHHALGDRRVAGEAELGRDGALVHLAAAGERRLLAVEREPAACDLVVLKRPSHQRGSDQRVAVVGEPGRAMLGELDHLRQLGAFLTARDRREEADRDLGLMLGVLD